MQLTFTMASLQLNTFIGALNTVVLLISSMTVAMSITAIQKKDKRMATILLCITLLCAVIFLIDKYFEWGHKISIMLYPGSDLMDSPETRIYPFLQPLFFHDRTAYAAPCDRSCNTGYCVD
jgi:heme/copper-type cytochrome/quinol oxidase subunit 3